jgi:hypothetical protein
MISRNFLWQRTIPVIAGWFAGLTGQTAVSGIPNHLNYRVIFIIHIYFTNVAKAE